MVSIRKRKQSFSKAHSFSGVRTSFGSKYLLIGGPGFSRVVFCNDLDNPEAASLNYGSNYVKTTKFTLITFVPKALFEQFRRVANAYFLICAILSFTPLSPYAALTSVLPFVFVIGLTMGKELVEDRRRKKQDIEVNNRKVKVHVGGGRFEYTKWMDLRVGHIVKVEKDEFFPADLILISSSYEEAICYVETRNLDGETNLKQKQAVEATLNLNEDSTFQNFKAVVRCEDPNPNLYSFIGSLDFDEKESPLSPQQLLLRDSKLKNTDYIYGAVIFTGQDTKVVQNSTTPPSKRSKIEKRTDNLVYFLFFILVLMSFIGSIFFVVATKEDLEDGMMTRWYLRPDDTTIYYDPKRARIAALLQFLTALMLFGNLIPISLYVTIEIVKVLQTIFINQDMEMYYEEGDRPARARTSNLNEELGQVDMILSDKTGTLTSNCMEFVKCSIGGNSYGQGITEVEKALARKRGLRVAERFTEAKPAVKAFNFTDERIMNGNWMYEPCKDVIRKFFLLLSTCHTVIPEMEEESGKISYEAESPDEAAFVIAAREIGFEFYGRSHTSISLFELDPISGEKVKRVFELLNLIEFTSSRRRMSVIVRDEEGKLLLFCKGADSVMFERLAIHGREFEKGTRMHIKEYAAAGLRTLVCAYRELNEAEYNNFNEEFSMAKNLVSANRVEIVESVAEKVEKDLILLGATAVEDKLQLGVPECINKLAQAGIKIWVLTGDKMDTAINIGFACSLLREGMEQIVISSETPKFEASGRVGDESLITEALKESIVNQIIEGKALCSSLGEGNQVLALIIDGNSLTYALHDDVKDMFLELAINCATVICCRSSPKQKALVARLVNHKTGKTTLAIGDGANDVGMIQEADIGVGISGFDGMQAVMCSDVAIGQFRFLERLLLVHGHWCYRRISLMICYFFYKSIVFGFTLFFFEAYASFSGEPAYNDWYLTLYNICFSSLPAIAFGAFDQDVSAQLCLKFPVLYQEGVQNALFCWSHILTWIFNGILSSASIFFFCILAMNQQAFQKDGEVAGLAILGTLMCTCIIWVVNCQAAILVNHLTYVQHFFIWGSIVSWYTFLLAYGAIDPYISTSAFMVFKEACAPALSFWLVTLLVVVSTLLPYFIYSVVQAHFFPMYHQLIQRASCKYGQVANDPDNPYHAVRQRLLGPALVGYSARFEADSTHRR